MKTILIDYTEERELKLIRINQKFEREYNKLVISTKYDIETFIEFLDSL